MLMTQPMVLPEGLLLLPIADLPEHVRQQVEAEEGDYALTRPNSRTPSRIVDTAAAELLKEFRTPSTIVQAVIRYSRERKVDPEKVLEDAFPLLERLAVSRLLVLSSSDEAKEIQQSLQISARFMDFEILRCVQSLDDTELYEVRSEDGRYAALKLGRPNAPDRACRMFDREAVMLERVAGDSSPALLKSGVTESGQRYLLMEWCRGVDCASAAAQLRAEHGALSQRKLLALCVSILKAYARLHEKNVIHSDVHTRNVLVGDAGEVKIIDFGFARLSGVEHEFRGAQRAGVPFFFEPEYAKAALRKQGPPPSTALGEQHSLAALVYLLITGSHYLQFSIEKDEMLRQIAEDAPLPFNRRTTPSWPAVEEVLTKALSKRPSDRYASVAEFASALEEIALREEAVVREEVKPAPFPEAQEMLRSVLLRLDVCGELFASGLDAAPRLSLSYGSAGIAYALYRIACSRDDGRLLSSADLWITRAVREIERSDAFYNAEIDVTPESVGRVSPFHTGSGVYAVQLLIARAQGELLTQQIAMDGYLSAVRAFSCESLDITLGRSGTLLGAAFLLHAVKGCKYLDSTPLLDFGNDMLGEIWSELDTFRPIRECKQIAYSGAAHGWAGILFTTLTWCTVSGTPHPGNLEERLAQLAGMAERSGRGLRWKWSIRQSGNIPPGEAYMPGWCNGTAGFLHLWTLALRVLGSPEYARLAEGAALDCWESESPIGNLCCGFAGQAYGLLNMYKNSGDIAWMHRAQALTERAARSLRAMPSMDPQQALIFRPDSLYKGELGVALLAEELRRPKYAAMPFFDLDE
jgi:serine/threonine protein kinase